MRKCHKKIILLHLSLLAPILAPTSLFGTSLPLIILYELVMAHFTIEVEPSTFHHKVGHGDGSTFSTNVDIEMTLHLLVNHHPPMPK